MSYIHLTIEKRNQIEILRKEKYSTRNIARLIGVHHSTVAREIKRIPGEYSSREAQQDADKKMSCKGRPSKQTATLLSTIEDRLKRTWSPEQIAGREFPNTLSAKTIYNWLHKGVLSVDKRTLRRKGRPVKSKEKRGRFTIGRSIKDRPSDVKKRDTFGHWELDTMVSSRGKSKGCLATFVERKTRFYIALPMKNREKDSMFQAIRKVIEEFPKEALQTFTSDRGKEFACYQEVERLGIPFYFADAYAAWQRGSNENSNGLLREFFPKKTDFAKIETEEIIHALMLLNHRPRKCLGFKTPFEMLFHEISMLR